MKEKKPSLKMLITYAGMQFKGTSPARPSRLHSLKWSAYSRWSFRPNSAWGSIGTVTIMKMHPTLNMVHLKILKSFRFRGPLIGQIFVTNYRFIFKAEVSNTIFLQVPLNSLSKGIIRNILLVFFSV